MAAGGTASVVAALLCLQIITACKNCLMLGKEEKEMFRMHSDACLAQSGAAPAAVAALLAGAAGAGEGEGEALRRHVYCVLRRCKLVAKDGKLLKAAARRKLPATKALEQCSERSADSALSPEEVAWNLLHCAYGKKALTYDYMPPSGENQPADAA